MTLPTSGFYSTVINSFFGTLQATQQQALWTQFLQQYNLTANPSNTDVAAEAEFVSFIESQYTSNLSLSLSPDEIQKRLIVFNTFTIVLHMLGMLQDTVAAQTNYLSFLEKYQEQYTNMMGALPTYVANPNQTWSPNTDPTKFTFGYNNISAQDIANYVAFDLSSGQSVSLSAGSGFTLGTVTLSQSQVQITITNTPPLGPPTTVASTTVAVTPSTDPQILANNIAAAFETAMYSSPGTFGSTNFVNALAGLNANGMTIPWRFIQPFPTIPPSNLSSTDQQTEQTDNTNVSKARAEVNTRDQQWLQNAQGNRQVFADEATQANNSQSQTQESINQQANILNSIIETLKELVTAIAK